MYRMIAAMVVCASMTTLDVAQAQDAGKDKAKTQADIMRERAKACEGYHDQALQECLDNYVGPRRDDTTGEVESNPERRESSPSPAAPGERQKNASPGEEGQSKSGEDKSRARGQRVPVVPQAGTGSEPR
jgi:hypothetical protein